MLSTKNVMRVFLSERDTEGEMSVGRRKILPLSLYDRPAFYFLKKKKKRRERKSNTQKGELFVGRPSIRTPFHVHEPDSLM
jgi:hypothetical protein